MLMLIFLYLPVICSICMCLVVFPRLSSSLAQSASRSAQSVRAHEAHLGSSH